MINFLKVWVTSICATVFFITAVEMILPNNNMKKYAKFVLGLILIIIIINPLLKLVNSKYNIEAYENEIINYLNKPNGNIDYEKYKESNMENTLDNFKSNISKNCTDMLSKKYSNDTFKVDVDAGYSKDGNISINAIKLGIKNGNIENVKKVEINLQKKSEDVSNVMNDSKSQEIRNFLSKELGISDSSIIVYKCN